MAGKRYCRACTYQLKASVTHGTLAHRLVSGLTAGGGDGHPGPRRRGGPDVSKHEQSLPQFRTLLGAKS